ncbi:SUMF1/EgtB/PvdO family nonheme iron enzyme [Calycomorphotria hydatis]|uniref:Serine/threonine-protein kinase pkn1 n=1 Tax=Calycomorphotria hydatis TaxID=2528027 RepID=A0A517T4Q9_9PLAN|nr:SUMF1/EgtB/PvdO family nonheme iron enzyme [Calycomorphotria hydatis]QDT63331.1 Serine/threonine-protein kinase pkn1 [Calycomorphotria hydatis]
MRDQESLIQLVKQCLDLQDYRQIAEFAREIPPSERSEELQELFAEAQSVIRKTKLLVQEIDQLEAEHSYKEMLRKAKQLKKLRPNNARAEQVIEQYADQKYRLKSEYLRADSAEAQRSNYGAIVAVAILISLLVFGGTTFGVLTYLKNGGTSITITTDDPAAKYFIDGIEVFLSDARLTIFLDPGQHTLRIEKEGQPLPGWDLFEFEVVKDQPNLLAIHVDEPPALPGLDIGRPPEVKEGVAKITLPEDEEDSRINDGKLRGGIFRPIDFAALQAENNTVAAGPWDSSDAISYQKFWADRLKIPIENTVEFPSGESMTFMLIPPGEFSMGTADEEYDKFSDMARNLVGASDDALFRQQLLSLPSERPQHNVRITQPFYLSKYEVTGQQWQSAMDAGSAIISRPELPVSNVSKQAAEQFMGRLDTGDLNLRLPTEAEWEYACRAGSPTPWYFGGDVSSLKEHAWYSANSNSQIHQGGELSANPWGLHDMYGNVSEWCADKFDASYYSNTSTDDPGGPKSGNGSVLRGGDIINSELFVRSAYRLSHPDDAPRLNTGLRPVLPIPKESEDSGSSKDSDIPQGPFTEILIPDVPKQGYPTLTQGHEFLRLTGIVNYVAVSPDGRWAATATNVYKPGVVSKSAKRILLIDLKSENPDNAVLPLRGNKAVQRQGVDSLAFSPQGNSLLTLTGDEKLRKIKNHHVLHWDLSHTDEAYEPKVIEIPKVGYVPSVTIGGLGLFFWDMKEGAVLMDLAAHSQQKNIYELRKPGIGILDDTDAPADNPTDAIKWSIYFNTFAQKSFSQFTADRRFFISRTPSMRLIQVWDLHSADPYASSKVIFGDIFTMRYKTITRGQGVTEGTQKVHSKIIDFTTSPDSRKLITATADKKIRLWDLTNGSPAHSPSVYEFPQIGTAKLKMLPDNRHLVVSGNGQHEIWDFSKNSPQSSSRMLLGEKKVFLETKVAPNGKLLICSTKDNEALIWSLEPDSESDPIATFNHPDRVTCMAITPDSTRLITGCEDGITRIWNIEPDFLASN